MFRRFKNQNGFSLLEALVASIIFVIASAGLFSVFTAQRQSVNLSDRKLQAANFARQTLETLRAKVDASTWNSGELSVGNHSLSTTINGILYTANYTVTEDATTKVRKVVLTVTWTEP